MKRLLCALFGLMFTIPAMSANLPSGYTELEYIQSDGTHYIDTGIVPGGKKIGMAAGFQFLSTSMGNGAPALIGSGVSDNTDNCRLWGIFSGKWRVKIADQGMSGGTPDTAYHDVRVNMTDGGAYLDGTKIWDVSSQITVPSTNTNPIYLFSDNGGGGVVSRAKIYYIRLYEGSTLIAEYIPAKNSSNEIGFYDTKNNNFLKVPTTFTGGRELDPCRNLFDPDAVTSNLAVNASGEEVVSTVSVVSAYIPVTAGQTMTVSWIKNYTSQENVRLHAYNSNKTWLSQVSSLESGTSHNGQRRSFSGTIPANATYVRLSIPGINSEIKIEQGSTATAYTPYDSSCHTSANACNNLFDKDQEYLHGYVDTSDGSFKKATGSSDVQRSFRIPCSPNTTYVLSGMTANSGWGSFTSDAVGTVATRYVTGNGTITTGANDRYLIGMAYAIGTQYDYRATLKIEQGEIATEYCTFRGGIKIATTKYNNAAFSSVVTALSNAVDTIKTVVSNTITQATAVANLHSGKQQRPDESCPNGKTCLLVEDDNGTPHWYEIIERAPGIVPAGSGYTQVEYLQSSGTQYIDTGVYITSNNLLVKTKVYSTTAGTSTEQDLFGNQDGTDGRTILGLTVTNNWFLYTRYGTGTATPSVTMPAAQNQIFNIETHIENGHKWLVVDGVASETGTATNISNANKTVQLFANGNTNYFFKGRMYYFQMWDNNTLVRDMIPARRNSDGVLGMYDTVSGNFFTNAGSGNFYAPDQYVPSAYTRLEYIESTGTQYIDTNITGSTNAIIDMQGTPLTGDTVVFMLAPINATAYQNGFGQYRSQIAGTPSFDIATRRVYNVSYTSSSMTVNGTTSSYYIANNVNLALFGSTATNRRIANAKLYSAKIYNNDTLLRDFVPAQHGSDVGMYDLVTGNFYTDANGGNFTAGPVAQ